MQSFQDLNNYGNTAVSYGSANDYYIEFGSNLGNVTTTEYEDSWFNPSQQVDLVTLLNPSKDILITFQFNNLTSVEGMTISAGITGIDLVQASANSWTITGVRSPEEYDTAFNTVFVQTKPDVFTSFNMTVLVDDQRGNTRTWIQTVNLIENPLFSWPEILYTSEDINVDLDAIQITDTFAGNTNYRLNLSVADQDVMMISYGGNLFNELIVIDSKANINSLLTNSIVLTPEPDYYGGTSINTQLTRLATNTATGIINIPVVVSQVDEYYFPTPQRYLLDDPNNLTFQILDNDPTASSYSVTMTQTASANGTFRINGVSVGNSISISNSKANINSSVFSWQPAENYTANAQINFSQSKTVTGNVVVPQANAVPITLVPGIQNLTATTNYFINWSTPVFNTVTVGAPYSNYATLVIGVHADLTKCAFASSAAEANNLWANGSPTYYQWSTQGTAAQVQTALRNGNLYIKPGFAGGNLTLEVNIRILDTGYEEVIPVTFTQTTRSNPPLVETITSSTTWTPVWERAQYMTANVLLVGGQGGAGGAYLGGAAHYGGGGGAGHVAKRQGLTFTYGTTYPVTIGNGGSAGAINSVGVAIPNDSSGQPGGNTVAFGMTAPGGGGGKLTLVYNNGSLIYNRSGGSSGWRQYTGPTTFTSGTYNGGGKNNDGGAGGGGAGAGGNGGSANNYTPGSGGAGNVWTTGDGQSYSSGMAGAPPNPGGAKGFVKIYWY